GLRLMCGTHSQCVTDCVSQLSAIQCVEVEIAHTVSYQRVHLFDGDTGGDEAAGLRILFQPMESIAQPRWNSRSATLGKTQHLRKTGDGQNPRNNRRGDSGSLASVAKTQEYIGVVEELGDGSRRARVDLAFEIVQIRTGGRCLRVHL